MAPSAASICGKTAAQLTASSNRRASTMGMASRGLSIATPTTRAARIPSASATSVTCRASTSGVPCQLKVLSPNVPASVIAGIVSAGMKSRLPQWRALASRSAGPAASGGGAPRPRNAATHTMRITSAPFTTSGSFDPNKNVIAYAPQNVALL